MHAKMNKLSMKTALADSLVNHTVMNNIKTFYVDETKRRKVYNKSQEQKKKNTSQRKTIYVNFAQINNQSIRIATPSPNTCE